MRVDLIRPLASRVQLHSLTELLYLIDDGKLVLPEFQREYLWAEADVRSLLVTVFRGWPAGSLLLMEGEPAQFAVRSFESGPTPVGPPRYVVLDGQQRLTALFQAFRASGPDVYAIDLTRIPELAAALADPSDAETISWDIEDIEQAVVAFPRRQWERKYRSGRAAIHDALLLPTAVLLDPADFYRWRDEVSGMQLLPRPEILASRLTELYRQMLGGVQSYQFPCVVLESSVEPSAIARIFERLNRTGLRLGVFDLVVARTYERSWNLRGEFDRVRVDYPLIDRFFGDDGMPILQVLALVNRRNVRQAAVLDLEPGLVQDGWEAAAGAVDAGLRFLVTTCGVISHQWLPYRSQVLVLGALSLEVDLSQHTHRLQEWFWQSSFGTAFDVAANTRVVSEYEALRGRLMASRPYAAETVEEISGQTIWSATRRRSSAVWRAFLCALAAHGATDPTGAELDLATARRTLEDPGHTFVIEHLFPRVADPTVPESIHLRALNVILLARETVTGRRVEPWEAIVSRPPEQTVDTALASQFLRSRFELLCAWLSTYGVVVNRDIDTSI